MDKNNNTKQQRRDYNSEAECIKFVHSNSRIVKLKHTYLMSLMGYVFEKKWSKYLKLDIIVSFICYFCIINEFVFQTRNNTI